MDANDSIPEEIQDLFDLQDHIDKSMKLDLIKNDLVQSDMLRISKKDKVDDIFRDIDLNNEHFYTDSKSCQRYI
jgi:hypothetical protein